MNWGYKILLVIIGFIVTMLSMVYFAYKQNNEMIDTNYYEKELKYQTLIDASNNLNKVTNDTLIKQDIQGISIKIPRVLTSDFNKGKIEFIKNDNEKKDIVFSFSPDTNGVFKMDLAKFSNGYYTARINWENAKINYYREQKFIFAFSQLILAV
jgi:hypothetical protein